MIVLDSGKDICKDIRIALSAVAQVPLRVKKAEEVMRGEKLRRELA